MVLPLDPEARVGTIVAGRYRLERLLGAGGMGEVYVAVQQPLGRQVALKLMRAGLSGPAAQRFEREAKALAATLHPNIVTLFDYGVTGDGDDVGMIGGEVSPPAPQDVRSSTKPQSRFSLPPQLFMAMELVRGRTLREHLADHGRLTPAEALPILVDICRALDVAHGAGIVHRDLKPENVMLAETGRSITCKVLDFGIARLNGSGDDDNQRLTKTGHLVGTPGYMAPETVLEGVFDDPRSDLYAVGVIAWELLTNHSLFSAPTPIALVMKHALDPPPTLTATLRLSTPPHPALEQLLATLLHKDRHQRYASAADVIAAIEALPAAARLPIAAVSSPFDDIA
ncbi:MAG TPA: serine/threonine-protein kinase, partial [Myxococcota bacterium]